MATVIPNFTNGEKIYAGEDTFTYTIVNAGMHVCKIRTSKPNNSNLALSITQSGSVSATIATGLAVPVDTTTGQSSLTIQGTANCQPGDVITFGVTSANVNDRQLNTLKSEILVKQGSGN